MPKIRKLLISTLACAVLAGSAGAGQALASHGQLTYFEASSLLLKSNTRQHTLEQLKYLGVKALRIELKWSEVAPAPASATKPSFQATNPVSYDWGNYGTLLPEIKKLGWSVLLTVTGPAPRWATANHKAPYITRPDPQDFEEFTTAVAREFGSEVSIYSIWNEPNESVFLLPQWNSNGTSASGRIYRGLFQAGYAGLKAGGRETPRSCSARPRPSAMTVSIRTRKARRHSGTRWRRWRSCAKRCASTRITGELARAASSRSPATRTTRTRCPPARATCLGNGTT